MPVLSVLDLSPIVAGADAAQALHNSLGLAQHTEALGYHRYWVAEHHNMAGIASAATAVVIGHIAAGTSSIRVGSGGIMLPNHAPLMVAEQFGTLAALFPDRIDLGLGRAPGTDGVTAHALRRTLHSDPNQFPNDVLELKGYLGKVRENQKVMAVPGQGSNVPLYILGSSLFGAQLAAILGLPFAFASHFAPAAMMRAIALYREEFTPSEQLSHPYVMLGYNICAADTEAEAWHLRTSGLRALLNLRMGKPGPLPAPIDNFEATLSAEEQTILNQSDAAAAVGDAAQIRQQVSAFVAKTQADELIITAQIFDHEARCRSYSIAYEACSNLNPDTVALAQ
ncbi:MAG: LLM class flavin-dependent oxidoreductase [Pseudomonadota bacterium]|nr:LLM class flavin-dependent oxidoreductase [Pseudomonadota bacterium]